VTKANRLLTLTTRSPFSLRQTRKMPTPDTAENSLYRLRNHLHLAQRGTAAAQPLWH